MVPPPPIRDDQNEESGIFEISRLQPAPVRLTRVPERPEVARATPERNLDEEQALLVVQNMEANERVLHQVYVGYLIFSMLLSVSIIVALGILQLASR